MKLRDVLIPTMLIFLLSEPLHASDYDCNELLHCTVHSDLALGLAETLRNQGEAVDWSSVRQLEKRYTYLSTLLRLTCGDINSKRYEDLYQTQVDRVRDRSSNESFISILGDYVGQTNQCLERTQYFR